MKKFLSKIPLFIVAVIMLLSFGVFGISGFASASTLYQGVFVDKYNTNSTFEHSIQAVYAGETLVAVDQYGNVLRAEDGLPSSFTVSTKLDNTQVNYIVNGSDTFMAGGNKYLVYGEGVLVYVCADKSANATKVFYSADAGKNWKQYSDTLNGTPITIAYGNGLFAVMTAESASRAKLYISEDGYSSYVLGSGSFKIDYNFSFSNGYFFTTEYFEDGTSPEVKYSVDLVSWDSFTSPIAPIYSNNGDISMISNPNLWTVRVNNKFYIFGYQKIYTTTDLEGVWSLLSDSTMYTDVYKVVAYQNGILFGGRSAFYYAELTDTDVIFHYNTIYAAHDLETTKTVVYANIVAESDTKLCLGYSGQYGQYISESQDNSEYLASALGIYNKQIKHTVTFVDYNGNVISKVEVPDGKTVVVPSDPTRTGYTFTGWDKDTSATITSDTTFTAQYEINKHTVTFTDYNGQVISTCEVNYGSTVNASDIPTPTRDGHQFTGWNMSTTAPITSDTTFVAQYTEMATLTIKYPKVVGTKGLENQFFNTELNQATFTYLIGDVINEGAYLEFYTNTLLPWITDYASDNDYDYDTKFISWDKEIPERITQDTTITANFVELHNVRLEYYSQVRFTTVSNYYYCFIGYLKIERLIPDGETIKLDEFKKPGLDYETYSQYMSTFYNNLRNFEFLGWDTDITAPITEDTIIKGEYNMPTINVKMYDADNYLFNDEDQAISFLSVNDLVALQSSGDKWGYFVEVLRNFFLLRWDEVAELAHDQFDWANYIQSVAFYNTPSSQLLTPFVVLDVQNPDIYGGIFMEGSVEEDSAILKYYKGDVYNNDLTYWINPVVFANDLYPLTTVVTYGVALDSVVKEVEAIWNTIMDIVQWLIDFIMEYWWLILIVVLAIIFRKPLAQFLKMIFDAIKKFFAWLGKKIKNSSKKSSSKTTSNRTRSKKKKYKKEKSA